MSGIFDGLGAWVARKRLESRLAKAEAEVALCRGHLIAMSRRHPSLRGTVDTETGRLHERA